MKKMLVVKGMDEKASAPVETEEEALYKKRLELLRKKREKDAEKAKGSAQPVTAASAAAPAPAAPAATPAGAATPAAPAAAASVAKASTATPGSFIDKLFKATPASAPAAPKTSDSVPLKKAMNAKEAAAAILARAGARGLSFATPGKPAGGASAAATPASAQRPPGELGATPGTSDGLSVARPSVKRATTRRPDSIGGGGAGGGAVAAGGAAGGAGGVGAKRPRPEDAQKVNEQWSKALKGSEREKEREKQAVQGGGAGAPQEAVELRRVYVGDLPDHADDIALRQALMSFGKILDAKVVPGKSFGFVTFADGECARAAVAASQAAAEGEAVVQIVVAGQPAFVEWPRGAEMAQWQAGPEAQFVLLAQPEDRAEAMRRMVNQAAQEAFYTQGGALPEAAQGQERELVCYDDLL